MPCSRIRGLRALQSPPGPLLEFSTLCVCASPGRLLAGAASWTHLTETGGQGCDPLVTSSCCHTTTAGAHLSPKHGRRPLQGPCFAFQQLPFMLLFLPPGENLWYLNKFAFVFCYYTSMFSYYTMQEGKHLSLWDRCQKEVQPLPLSPLPVL